MPKSSSEKIVDFILEYLPSLLPKPVDSVAQTAIDTFRGSLDGLLSEPRIQLELLGATQRAESQFLSLAQTQLKNDALAQAIASFPIFDRELFQSTLADLPNHLQEEYLASDLRSLIDNDWNGKFPPEELREGIALYLNCLRVELLKVEVFADVVTRLATLRTDQRTEQILAIVTELSQLVKSLLTQQQAKVFFPGRAPLPPSLVVGRDDDLQILKKRLLSLEKQGSINLQVITAIRGWPGVGKTTMASVLAFDKDVIEKYSDGVLWVSLGQEPDIHSSLAAWGRALGIDDILSEKTVEDASRRLSAMLRNKRVLLIIDDVWKDAHAIPFRVGGTDCAVIITTRANDIAQSLAGNPNNIYRLNVLTEEKSLELLRMIAPDVVLQHSAACRELAQELEGLPLALQVAGHLLNVEAGYGFSVIDLLKELHDGKKILESVAPMDRMDLANEITPTVAVLFQKSTDRLDEFTKDCFAYLGVFAPKPATFDLMAMQSVWQVDDPKPIVRSLVDRGLLEPVQETERFQMHALLVAHAKSLLTG